MDKRFADILYAGLIIFVIIFIVSVIIFAYSESKNCLVNPFIYGAKKTYSECICYNYNNGHMPTIPLSFSFNGSRMGNIAYKMPNLERSYFNITLLP